MSTARRKRLEAAGWRFGTPARFLGLTPEQVRLMEAKLVLGDCLRRHRIRAGMTQGELARRIGSSQSRIAKLEAGGIGTTLDLLFKALFATGATPARIGRALARSGREHAA